MSDRFTAQMLFMVIGTLIIGVVIFAGDESVLPIGELILGVSIGLGISRYFKDSK